MSSWLRHRSRLGVAFSDRFLLALRQGGDSTALTKELPAGAVEPSPVTPNIDSVRDVAKWTTELLEALGSRRANETVALVLPDLAVTTALFHAPAPSSHRQLREAFRERLPYPDADVRCDFWNGGRGEILAAGVRKAVIGQYESVIEAAGCRTGWVDAASLARLPDWSREVTADDPAPVVWVQLYGSHYSLTAFRSGELFDVRVKLRSPGDIDDVSGELLRLPKLYESRLKSLKLSGRDARECAERLDGQLGDVSTDGETEEAHLAAALRTLIARS
jgi:hypothetical protein